MKSITNNTTLAVLIVLALVLGMFAFLQSTPRAEAVGSQATVIGTATTSAAIAVTSSTRVLATTTNPLGVPGTTSFTRVYASICNPSSTLVYLNINGDKAASLPAGTFTTVIAAAAGYNACYEIRDFNQYSGSITASSTNQTSVNVQVSDYVQ